MGTGKPVRRQLNKPRLETMVAWTRRWQQRLREGDRFVSYLGGQGNRT